MTEALVRRYPIGAELTGDGRAHFRVWAPNAARVDLVLEASADREAPRTFHPLESESAGYFAGVAPADAGTFYPFVDAWMKVHPDDAQHARRFLHGFEHHHRADVERSRSAALLDGDGTAGAFAVQARAGCARGVRSR